jgi:hypothetical protein
MEQIVNTRNLFIDSSRGLTSTSKGDDFTVNLINVGVECRAGEYMRLTLDNFCMAKTFADVNTNNNQFTVRHDTLTAQNTALTSQNYSTVRDLATEFATQFGFAIVQMVTLVATYDIDTASLTPSSGATINGTTDNIISFTITTKDINNSAVNHGLTAEHLKIQFYSNLSDSYALLGGNRIINDADETTSSVTITIPSASTIKVQCLYPAQRSTSPYVYLRATNVVNDNIETLGLAHPEEDRKTDAVHSDILGRMVVDTEWIQYTAQTGREFFLNVHQKSISLLRLMLTDGRNRPLGRVQHSPSLTATGTGTSQSTLGNLNFTAVLRIDTIRQRQVMELQTPHLEPKIPARFSKILTHQGNGENDFGRKPGY